MLKSISRQRARVSSLLSVRSLLGPPANRPHRGNQRTDGEKAFLAPQRNLNYMPGRNIRTEAGVDDIIITDRCVSQLKKVASNNECLRVAVEGGGCSGFEYKMSLDPEIHGGDKIFEKNGVKVVVDETSLEFLKGATVDYADELIRSAFRITKNPIAEKGCSCGTSFAVKMD